MVMRTFIFCDICNQPAIRIPDRRNGTERESTGRRTTDGRVWFEGSLTEAVVKYGWEHTDDGLHICPKCLARRVLPPG